MESRILCNSMLEVSKCHVCGGTLVLLSGFSVLLQVTSDCRPWNKDGQLAICQRCGSVQKPVTKNWHKEIEQIYSGYDVYSQGGGAEQSTFDSVSGAYVARSEKIIQMLLTTGHVPITGKLLDIGCGNGTFLKVFGASYPEWQMMGMEVDDRNKKVIESIPGVTGLHLGPLKSLNDFFDMIVLIHALEHIPNPIKYLRSLIRHLKPGGLLFVEVPDLKTSPFDILIADHCTHFTNDILNKTVNTAGFYTLSVKEGFIPKELSLLAKNTLKEDENIGKQIDSPNKRIYVKKYRVVTGHMKWLQKLVEQGKDIVGTVGIFGTSISATWLASSLGGGISFFVDEDCNRIGRNHLGYPIYDPTMAPKGSSILMPFQLSTAASIAKRFDKLNIKFVLPSF